MCTRGASVRIERFPEVDVASLPTHPTPPDFWQERAACFGVEPDVFFPVSEEEAGPALAFCAVCPIREECLSWALKNGERYGVWGGTTEQQRRRLHGPGAWPPAPRLGCHGTLRSGPTREAGHADRGHRAAADQLRGG